jgi:hypothetical protein
LTASPKRGKIDRSSNWLHHERKIERPEHLAPNPKQVNSTSDPCMGLNRNCYRERHRFTSARYGCSQIDRGSIFGRTSRRGAKALGAL